jgi:hypothetical protein
MYIRRTAVIQGHSFTNEQLSIVSDLYLNEVIIAFYKDCKKVFFIQENDNLLGKRIVQLIIGIGFTIICSRTEKSIRHHCIKKGTFKVP